MEDNESFQDHITRMRNSGEWFGYPEIYAVSIIYNIPIRIFHGTGQPPTIIF